MSESWQQEDSANDEQINLAMPEDTYAITKAKELLNWSDNAEVSALRIIFDRINLGERQEDQEQYWQPKAIANEKPVIPYPHKSPEEITGHIQDFRQQIEALLNRENWHNLSLLTVIIEKIWFRLSVWEMRMLPLLI